MPKAREFDMQNLIGDLQLDVVIKTRFITSFRVWIGFKLLYFAVWVIGCKVEVTEDDE